MNPGNDPFTAEKFQFFLAGLQGLNADEVRKAKILYIRNAISEYQGARASWQVMYGGWRAFLFRPMSRISELQLKVQADRIRNALDVWADDIKGESFDFP